MVRRAREMSMSSGSSISSAALVFFIGVSITYGQLTHYSIRSVQGPSLHVLAELLILSAFFLFVIFACIRHLVRWHRAFKLTILGLFAFGVVFFFWQQAYTRRVMTEATAAIS